LQQLLIAIAVIYNYVPSFNIKFQRLHDANNNWGVTVSEFCGSCRCQSSSLSPAPHPQIPAEVKPRLRSIVKTTASQRQMLQNKQKKIAHAKQCAISWFISVSKGNAIRWGHPNPSA
jgi:hypothetical protein